MESDKHSTIKGYSIDFILNILATCLSTGVMQLVVLPQLSTNLNSTDYGVMLTATGFMNVLVNALGNNLSYSRLKQAPKYEARKLTGDYQIFLLAIIFISFISVVIFNFYLGAEIEKILFPFALITITNICKGYYLVTYRLSINYRRNLIAHFFSCLGYCFGGFILAKSVPWPWVFLPADVLSLIYIFFSSKIMREPVKKTILFSDSAKVTWTLLIGGLLGNVTLYLDRFIIYPILGGDGVSTYSTAAWFSKSVLLVFMPINGVLLSYITAGKLKLNKKKYDVLCLILLGCMILCWLFSVLLGPFVTGWMYPTLIDQAKPYISYVSISIVISIIGNFISIIVFAYAPIKWQTIIPAIRVGIYLVLGIVLVNSIGIIGMITAVFIANLVCIIIQFIIARKWVREDLVQHLVDVKKE